MGKVLVMTDSVGCISQEIGERFGIKVVPAAHIYWDNQEYIDGVTLSATEAYQLIKKDPDKFMTSAPTPAYLVEQYTKMAKGADNILHITLSSALSAGNKTAQLAAELFKEKSPKTTIRVFDSLTVASGQGLIAIAAAKAAACGMNLDEVYNCAEKVRQQTQCIMMLDTLRYVYRTGRMSKLGSRIASMFNIRPINTVTKEGKVEMVDRTRNRDDGLEIMVNWVEMNSKTKDLHLMITHADAMEVARQLQDLLQQKFNPLSLFISDYSPVMGYGAGPGAILIGFHPEVNLSK